MERNSPSHPEFIARRPPTAEELEDWVGWRVTDVNGSSIGHVEGLALDAAGDPAWIVVSEFRLGDGRRFVIPTDDAVGGGGHVWSPHSREHIRLTARITGPRMTPQSLRRLRAHYENEPRAA